MEVKDHEKIKSVKLEVSKNFMGMDSEKLDWFLEEQKINRKRALKYTLWTIVILFLLTTFAFFQPALFPIA